MSPHPSHRISYSRPGGIISPSPMSVPARAPGWVSTRRIFEEKLQDLQKCSNLTHVKQIHAQIIKQDLHRDVYITPKLISAFSLCRQMVLAVNVFNQIPEPNLHLYNTLIRAHVQNSQPTQAFAVFFEMQSDGVLGDNFTYPFLLKACTGKNWLPVIRLIHNHIEKAGFLSDIFVPNSLIDCYSKCGVLGVNAAKKVFVMMEERDIVTWNSMLGGLLRAGELSEARNLFDKMPKRDMISWNTMLDGYVKSGDTNTAFELFEKMPERNTVSWSTMVLGYSKSGDMEMAKILFDKMPVKNLVPWTIIVSGYAEKGRLKEANELFDQMDAKLKLDDAAAVSVLTACAESGMLGLGIKVHDSINRTRFKCSTMVSNSLMDMYAKCGSINDAMRVFNNIMKRDVVSWNVMIQGLAMHGHGEKAINLFSKMKKEKFEPDKVTYIGVLCACTHTGYVDEGMRYFHEMRCEYGIVPQIEHYGCVVDLLGRGGRLDDALRMVRTMPMKPNVVVWGALLGACRMHNATELAKVVLDEVVTLEPSDPGNYSMLSNIYAAAGEWDRVAHVRSRMKSLGVQKPSGASFIEVDNELHEFTVLDRSHPESDRIYRMVDRLVDDLQRVGYTPKVQQ